MPCHLDRQLSLFGDPEAAPETHKTHQERTGLPRKPETPAEAPKETLGPPRPMEPWDKYRFTSVFRSVLILLAGVSPAKHQAPERARSFGDTPCPSCGELIFDPNLVFHACELGRELQARYRTAIEQSYSEDGARRVELWRAFVARAVEKEESLLDIPEDFACCPDCGALVASFATVRHPCPIAKEVQEETRAKVKTRSKKKARRSRKKGVA